MKLEDFESAPESFRHELEEMSKWGRNDPSFKHERGIREVAYIPGADPVVTITYSPRTKLYYATHARYLDTPVGTGSTPEEAVSQLRSEIVAWPVTSNPDGFFKVKE